MRYISVFARTINQFVICLVQIKIENFGVHPNMDDFSIVVFEDTDLLVDEKRPSFSTLDFGGTIPHAGDLIALPAAQFVDGPIENPRIREVIERYFWPSSDLRNPTRIGLLVRERRPRKSL